MSLRQELLDTLAPWVEAQVCQHCPLIEAVEAKTWLPPEDCTPAERDCPSGLEIGGTGCYHLPLWNDLVSMVDKMKERLGQEL